MPCIFLPVLPPSTLLPPHLLSLQIRKPEAVECSDQEACGAAPLPQAESSCQRGRGAERNAAGSSRRSAAVPGAPRECPLSSSGSACTRAGQGQSRRPAAGAVERHVKVRGGLRSCPELGPLLRGLPRWEGGDDVAARRSATSRGSDFRLPGTDPKKIIQTKKERRVRIYSQQHKGNDFISLGTSAQ